MIQVLVCLYSIECFPKQAQYDELEHVDLNCTT